MITWLQFHAGGKLSRLILPTAPHISEIPISRARRSLSFFVSFLLLPPFACIPLYVTGLFSPQTATDRENLIIKPALLMAQQTTSVASAINGQNWLGPLTTYSMPQSCSDSLSTLYNISPGSYLLQGATDMTTCFPSGYGEFQSDYYSPGVCPGGYTVACSRKSTAGSVTETIQTCCPTYVS
jgi:hypothetical protein